MDLVTKIDWINLISGIILTGIISGITYFVKKIVERNKVTSNLNQKIEGIWFSAEYDHKGDKQREERNTILEVVVKRASIGNSVTIKSNIIDQSNKNIIAQTGWRISGKMKGDTLMCEWFSTIKDTNRYGVAFLKFIDSGRAVGYWVGYSGVTRPMYGYWIMSKDKNDLELMSTTVLKEYSFKAYDVAFLIENFENKKLLVPTILLDNVDKL